jgi:glyceraldehyde 3-phosphate dehydrogenase
MMKKLRVAINGFGRIGRAFFRAARGRGEIEIVAINDIGEIGNIAYLLQYDTVYGRAPFEVVVGADQKFLIIDGQKVVYLSEREPAKLPWRDWQVDVVIESTGLFADYTKARAHLDAGARRVIITAPVKEEPLNEEEATVLLGVNEEKLKVCKIVSNASCTTNAASPIISILDETLGIEKAVLNTIHAYTATQSLVDSPAVKKGWREGRAAAQNIVPSSTGAAIAVTKAYPRLAGNFDGISLRVPVVCGSIADITFIAKRETSAEEVNRLLTAAARDKRWAGIFAVSTTELVSSDIIGRSEGSIAELSMTRVVGGNLVKVLAWYDNEMGYAHTLVGQVIRLSGQL